MDFNPQVSDNISNFQSSFEKSVKKIGSMELKKASFFDKYFRKEKTVLTQDEKSSVDEINDNLQKFKQTENVIVSLREKLNNPNIPLHDKQVIKQELKNNIETLNKLKNNLEDLKGLIKGKKLSLVIDNANLKNCINKTNYLLEKFSFLGFGEGKYIKSFNVIQNSVNATILSISLNEIHVPGFKSEDKIQKNLIQSRQELELIEEGIASSTLNPNEKKTFFTEIQGLRDQIDAHLNEESLRAERDRSIQVIGQKIFQAENLTPTFETIFELLNLYIKLHQVSGETKKVTELKEEMENLKNLKDHYINLQSSLRVINHPEATDVAKIRQEAMLEADEILRALKPPREERFKLCSDIPNVRSYLTEIYGEADNVLDKFSNEGFYDRSDLGKLPTENSSGSSVKDPSQAAKEAQIALSKINKMSNDALINFIDQDSGAKLSVYLLNLKNFYSEQLKINNNNYTYVYDDRNAQEIAILYEKLMEIDKFKLIEPESLDERVVAAHIAMPADEIKEKFSLEQIEYLKEKFSETDQFNKADYISSYKTYDNAAKKLKTNS